MKITPYFSRHFLLTVVTLTVGSVLAFKGLLSAEYVALAGTLHIGVTARAISGDIQEKAKEPTSGL